MAEAPQRPVGATEGAPTAGEVALALDVGEARIGVARGEVGSSFAFPRGALTRDSQAQAVAAVLQLAAEEDARWLVVGLPSRTDGRDSKQTRRVRAFAQVLSQAAGPHGPRVVFEDERFTTALARRRLASAPTPARKRREKGRVDAASAVAILEGWLARAATPWEAP